MESFLRDLKFGLRQLAKSPGFTLVASLALGLGIGSVTTQLSVINGLFFKGLPFEEAEKIVHIERVNFRNDNFMAEIPILEFVEWGNQQEVFSELAGYYTGTVNLTIEDTVERYSGCFISGNAFDLLGVQAAMGRTLKRGDEDPGAPEVVLLSHKVWQRDFGADPDIVGTSAIINGRSATIVGVMPQRFAFPVTEEIWIPLLKQQVPARLAWDTSFGLEVIGRLKEGTSIEEAQASMSLVAENLKSRYPENAAPAQQVRVQSFKREYSGGDEKTLTAVMFLITCLILLIASANVANLLLARSARRRNEVAIRSALGATRQRILSQFLTESILLAILGSLIGIIFSHYSIRSISSMMVEMNTPFWIDVSLDGRVLALTIVVTIMTGLSAGLVPAWRVSRLNENTILKDDIRTGSSLHMGAFSKALVIVQISVAAIVLTLVVLFVKSVGNALAIDYAYDPDRSMTARLGLFEEVYPTAASRAQFLEALLSRLEERPEISSASATSRYQFMGGSAARYQMPGEAYQRDQDRPLARIQHVAPGFFDLLNLPILAGRGFLPEDHAAEYPRHAVVNEAFAEREWPGSNPIGKRFQPDLNIPGYGSGNLPYLEIIGVCGPMQEKGFFSDDEEDGAAFFVPMIRATTPVFVTILATGTANPADLLPVMREEIAKLDRNLPLYSAGTPRQINNQAMVQLKFFTDIFLNFGILATLLSAVGIYGVISFSVNQRIMEFGIRQALGATRSAIFQLVYHHAMKQLTYGFLIALLLLSPIILFPAVKQSLGIFFYEVDPDSLLPYLYSFGFVAIVSLLAATPPAIRAARIQPAKALRYE